MTLGALLARTGEPPPAVDDRLGLGSAKRFVFVREIPKTASGKILRRLLRGGQFTEVRP